MHGQQQQQQQNGVAGSGTAAGGTNWGGSGFQTPAMLSPNATLTAAAIRGLNTVDCMEALLNDKDFALSSAFNTPGRAVRWSLTCHAIA
jgi:hypothetical protein